MSHAPHLDPTSDPLGDLLALPFGVASVQIKAHETQLMEGLSLLQSWQLQGAVHCLRILMADVFEKKGRVQDAVACNIPVKKYTCHD